MKWIILFVLCLNVLHLQAQQVCEPGSTSKQDCNTCKCSTDGTRLACTRRFCLPHEITPKQKRETAQEDEEQTVPNGNQVCVPNEIKMEDCNRCKCASNGIGFFCTKRQCPTREKRQVTEVTKPEPGQPGFSCTPGETFLNKCNTCVCSKDGLNAACTLQYCISWGGSSEIRNRRDTTPAFLLPGYTCTPGEQFPHECNTCTCAKDGKNVSCTRKFCADRKRRDLQPVSAGTAAVEFSCTPGQSFQQECNTCVCSKDGKNAACTQKFCVSKRKRSATTPAFLLPGFTCTPGEQFPHECNTCTCAKDGKNVSCTRKFCADRKRRDLQPVSAGTAAVEFSCTPGQSFQQECNTCVCSKDGKNAACTQKFCVSKRKRSATTPAFLLPGFTCTPGEQFPHECNTCTCAKDGKNVACTRKFCEERKRRDTVPVTGGTSATEFSCTPGESFKRDCNTCVCALDGKKAACTLKFCIPQRKRRDTTPAVNSPGFTCTPGQVFKDDCNTCTCADDGKTAGCTYMACVSNQNTLVASPPALACSPGESFLDYDKSCVCNADGASATCSEETAVPRKRGNEFSCTPGETYKQDCNTCVCADNGKNAACTEIECESSGYSYLPVETPAVAVPVNSPGFTCTPGETFKDDCNTCTCSEDGKTAACTYMACIDDTLAQTASGPALSCSPGESFEDYGKSCVCNADGASATCSDETPTAFKRDTEAVTKVQRECDPGTSFKASDGCNTCFCASNGVAACTLKECLPASNRKRRQVVGSCTPGTSFQAADGCNTCFCGSTGHAVCTLKFCLSNADPTGSNLVKRDTAAVGKVLEAQVCVPGTRFMDDDGCNTCFCTPKGQRACTLMMCPPA